MRRKRIRDERDDGLASPSPRLMAGLRSPRFLTGGSVNANGSLHFPVGAVPNSSVAIIGTGGDDGSVISSDSLISTGSSRQHEDSDSDIEYDNTDNLADEFDQYKDQNLEKMRTDVEGMSSNFDGMMSQALTKALMDDMDEDDGAVSEMTVDALSSMDIEATVLCDTIDWLKKREGASKDDRYVCKGCLYVAI